MEGRRGCTVDAFAFFLIVGSIGSFQLPDVVDIFNGCKLIHVDKSYTALHVPSNSSMAPTAICGCCTILEENMSISKIIIQGHHTDVTGTLCGPRHYKH